MFLECYAPLRLRGPRSSCPPGRSGGPGDDALWERSETDLRSALDHAGRDYTVSEGEGAFLRPEDRLLHQLAEERHGEALLERGIVYAPDFVINAGGIINVSVEFMPGGYDEEASLKRVNNIRQAMKDIFATAKSQGIPTNEAAIVLAEKIVAEGRRKASSQGAEL